MKIVIVILGILFAVSWGTIIPICISLWNNLKKVKADYDVAVEDGTITDAERVAIADDAMAAINDASNIFQFVANLIKSILVVIQASKLTAKRLKKTKKLKR